MTGSTIAKQIISIAILLFAILTQKSQASIWLRMKNEMGSLKIDPTGNYLAFLESKKNLSILGVFPTLL